MDVFARPSVQIGHGIRNHPSAKAAEFWPCALDALALKCGLADPEIAGRVSSAEIGPCHLPSFACRTAPAGIAANTEAETGN